MLNLRLFQKTSDLENKVDSFFLKLAEAGVIYRLAVRNYLREGLSKEYTTHFEQVCNIETSADTLRSEIKLAIYSDMLIPDSRGDVLGLIETADEVFSLMKTSLWAFSIEAPTIDEELIPGYRRKTIPLKLKGQYPIFFEIRGEIILPLEGFQKMNEERHAEC